MYKINWKNWKAAVDEALAHRETKKQLNADLAAAKITFKEFIAGGGLRDHDHELTLLYSIRAHGRGRIHRRKAALTWEQWRKLPANVDKDVKSLFAQQPGFTNNGGTLTLMLELEDQAAFIADAWKGYVRMEEKAA